MNDLMQIVENEQTSEFYPTPESLVDKMLNGVDFNYIQTILEPSAEKKLKQKWKNAFQKWSNEKSQDGTTSLGKCGYGSMCDYCMDNDIGRPCVRALNCMLREKGGKIDYSKIDEEYFENVFQGGIDND